MSIISLTSTPKISYLPNISSSIPSFKPRSLPSSANSNGINGGLLIECSSRPQKKATKHHMKTRPRKTQAWDIRRKPTVYDPLPPLPPDWTLVSSGAADENGGGDVAAITEVALADSALQAPISSG